MNIYDINGNIINTNSSMSANKTGVFFGDSLTDLGGGSDTNDGFLKIIHETTGLITKNEGTSGAWWQTGGGQEHSAVQRVNALISEKRKYDLYVFLYGTNNGSSNDTGETSSDTTTMCGAIRYCMEKLKAYDPTAQILVCLPPQRESGTGQKNVNEVIKKIVEEEYSIKTFDVYRNSGIVPNTTIANINYLTDGLHFADNGKTSMGKALAGEIKHMLCL